MASPPVLPALDRDPVRALNSTRDRTSTGKVLPGVDGPSALICPRHRRAFGLSQRRRAEGAAGGDAAAAFRILGSTRMSIAPTSSKYPERPEQRAPSILGVKMTTFAELGLSEPILEALRDVGYEQPSPIQAQAIPLLLQGLDVIGQAQTGSGKTAAFGLPMIQYVDATEQEVQGLVLTPTRELCIQVTQALRTYGQRKGVDIVAVFGGAPIRTQQAQLRAGGQIVVGTVGRVKDLISRHSLMLHSTRFVVLDEADEMLDLGFLEDVEKILALTPSSRQTALFSATMPPEIQRLADKYLYDPQIVKVKSANLTVDTVEQFSLEVASKDKATKLVEVLEAEKPTQSIIFVRTKIRADQLYRTLRDKGMNVKALHGDMSQGQRDGVMISFKDGRTPYLVATDVAARGLDISTVSHVINFDVPVSPDIYVHRIGRTGRVGRSGRAITFYEPRQQRELEAIESHSGIRMAPWVKDARVAPTAPVPPKPRRHTKPSEAAEGKDSLAKAPLRKLIIAGGRAAGIEPSDVIHALTKAGSLDGEAVHNVRVLEHFALAEVPERATDAVLAGAGEVQVAGQPLRLELARA
jgi:ATP-dependent RNA helicase DeaD